MNQVSDAAVVSLLVSRQKGISLDNYKKLLGSIGDPGKLLAEPALAKEIYVLNRAFQDAPQVKQANADLARWQSTGISTIGLGERDYPSELSSIYNPPPILFYRGERASIVQRQPRLTVVGSRNADKVGCEIASQLSFAAALAGACIVSGLALGIDGAAHRGALQSQRASATVAVLGNGLANIYPTLHERLAKEILDQGGALISQFEPTEKPFPQNFLNRNRVLAGLAKAVLVIQAAARSGSLVTARYALEEGRDVLVVPGDITNPRCAGTNQLLKQGAYPCTEPADIFQFLPGLTPYETTQQQATEKLTPTQSKILELLNERSPRPYDEILEKLVNHGEAADAVLELEISELILRLPGNKIGLKPALIQRRTA